MAVGAGHAHELLMDALLDDPALFHHDDEVRAAQRAQPVGHDERGAAGDRAVERLENLVLRLAVDGRGRVVEQQDRRLEQHRARDGETLALAARQRVAALAEDGVVALRQLQDEVVGRRDPRGLLDLRRGGAGMAEGDVGRDGVRKQEALLEHEPDVAAQVVEDEVPHINAVHQQPAPRHVVEARDEAHQHALARARRPEDGHALAGLDVEVEAAQHGIDAAVGKLHFLEPHRALQLRAGHRVRRALHLDGCVHHLKHAARAD